MRELVYLAGPYRGRVRHNIGIAGMWAAQCAATGVDFICPHLNSAHMSEGDIPDAAPQFFLDMDINILSRCDVLALLPGWEQSAGTLAEKAFAEAHGIPVYEVADYLKRVQEARQ